MSTRGGEGEDDEVHNALRSRHTGIFSENEETAANSETHILEERDRDRERKFDSCE
jgi:hypothetical protein